MKAVDSHLLTLLKASSQFIVPIYQRVYSWQEPECAQLWADVIRAGSSPKLGVHFTGSIVYIAKDKSTITSAEPDLIIDGQQRITTVMLILIALAARLSGLPDGQREPSDGFSPKKIRNRYLLNDDEDGERQFKLVLSQTDKHALISLLQGVVPSGDLVARVVDNYAYFKQKLADPDLDLAVVCRGLDKLVVVDVKTGAWGRQSAACLRGDELHRQETVTGRSHPQLRTHGPAAQAAGEGLRRLLATHGTRIRRCR
jgi:hypothetical protein